MKQDLLIEYQQCNSDIFVLKENLVLSYAFQKFLEKRHIKSTRQLLSLIWAAPDSITRQLAWTEEQLTQFTDKLIIALSVVLPPEVLVKPEPKEYSLIPLRYMIKK